jgi:hypothetical protein
MPGKVRSKGADVIHPMPSSDPTPDMPRDTRQGSAGDSSIRPPSHCAHWPGAVCPPASPGFEQSAKAWLFELAPARWWHEETLHRFPVELARMVRLRLEADVVAMHSGLRAASRAVRTRETSRVESPQVPELYLREREWASAMLEQVRLVEDALRGACGRARRRPSSGSRSSTARAESRRDAASRSAMPRQRPATG